MNMNPLIRQHMPPVIVFLFLLFFLMNNVACKKEKDEYDGGITGSGEIEYNGIKYEINKGLYEYYGQFDGGVHNYRLYLFSDGVDIENESGSGNAMAIYFSTYTPPLNSGTIPHYSEDLDPIPNFEAEMVLDYDLDAEVGIRFYSFVDGDFTISKSQGNAYTIQFSVTTWDDEIITGQYSGNIFEI
jgi:hypothetical protein